jgi:pantoate--beta-alanine ligase
MGALHTGHASLMAAARRAGECVVVSIFVNPTQFAPHEDFARYPRNEPGDVAVCVRAGVDACFIPPVETIYREDAATVVHVARLSDALCGPHRPGHFDGVATVVTKLLNIVRPDVAYFGQKDAQQLAIIRQLVGDLNIDVEIVGCPTVREADGLALSSRNAYLNLEQRSRARCLYAALCEARRLIERGRRSADEVLSAMRSIIEAGRPAKIDYVSIVDPRTLEPVQRIAGPVLAALAVWIGQTRLIDNLLVDPRGSRG